MHNFWGLGIGESRGPSLAILFLNSYRVDIVIPYHRMGTFLMQMNAHDEVLSIEQVKIQNQGQILSRACRDNNVRHE